MDESEIKDLLQKIDSRRLPKIDKLRNESGDFITDYITAGNLINCLLHFSASIEPHLQLSKKEQGILTGNMVRVAKLYDAFLLLSSQKKAEASIGIARLICETSIILKYLVKNINQELCKKIIKSSLAYDKKLLEYVKDYQKNTHNLEKRIQESINKNFKMEGYDLNEINFKSDKDWCSIYDLAKEVNIPHYYETIYRTYSSAVHGTWHHLRTYCLKEKNDIFEPEISNKPVSVQLIESTSFVALEAAIEYTNFIWKKNPLLKAFQTYRKWLLRLGLEHEKFLNESNKECCGPPC